MALAGRSAIIEVSGAGAATRARAQTSVQRGHIAGSLDCCSGALELSLDLGVPEFLRVAQVGRVGSVPLVQCCPRGRRLRYVPALVPRAAVVPKSRGSVLLCQGQQAPILFVLPRSGRLVDLVLGIPNRLLVAQHRRRGALLRLERLPCCRTDRRVTVVQRLRVQPSSAAARSSAKSTSHDSLSFPKHAGGNCGVAGVTMFQATECTRAGVVVALSSLQEGNGVNGARHCKQG